MVCSRTRFTWCHECRFIIMSGVVFRMDTQEAAGCGILLFLFLYCLLYPTNLAPGFLISLLCSYKCSSWCHINLARRKPHLLIHDHVDNTIKSESPIGHSAELLRLRAKKYNMFKTRSMNPEFCHWPQTGII